MSEPQSPQPGIDIPTPEHLAALADVLVLSLPAGRAEIERRGNPADINLNDYLLGAMSVVATIRETAKMLARGEDPFTQEPVTPEMEQAIRDLAEHQSTTS